MVVDDLGEILPIRRIDNDDLALSGEAMDLGESMPAAAARDAGRDRHRG